MLICKEKNFGFYHVPKCGGTSIIQMLQSLPYKWEQIGEKHVPLSAKDYDSSGLTLFANIRNPFARIVSIYEYNRQFSQEKRFREIDFRSFFYEHFLNPEDKDSQAHRPIHEYLLIDGSLPENLSVVHLEKSEVIWPDIIKVFFNREVVIPKVNSTIHDDPIGYFDERMRNEVIKREWWAFDQYCW